jgi:hypothetical protein
MKNQQGNVLVIILIAVILLAALSFAVTKGGQGGGGKNILSEGDIKIAVSQILKYAKSTEHAIKQLQLINNCSENEISFENSVVADYTTNPNSPVNKSCHVFDVAGGGLTFLPVQNYGYDASSYWQFTGKAAVEEIGTEAPSWNSPFGSELVALMRVKTKELCMALNEELGVINYYDHWLLGTRPPYDPASPSGIPFIGAYIANVGIDGQYSELIGKKSACYQHNSNENAPGYHYFYHTLIAR